MRGTLERSRRTFHGVRCFVHDVLHCLLVGHHIPHTVTGQNEPLIACDQFGFVAVRHSRHHISLFKHVIAQRSAHRQHAVDAIAAHEPAGVCNALRLIRQTRFVVDGQAHSLAVTTEHNATTIHHQHKEREG